MDAGEQVRQAEKMMRQIPPDALRIMRQDRSRQEIARQAGLTRQAIFSYEQGRRRPTGMAAYGYARALGLLDTAGQ